MIDTEAWVIHEGPESTVGAVPPLADLTLEPYSFPAPVGGEVLVEPLYGCWEANMTHALERLPVDICRQRGEDRIVLGNAGVVRVLDPGPDASKVREGDICLWAPFGVVDRAGYMELVHGYDAPGTVGVLARRTKIHEDYLVKVPEGSPYSLPQWATYARYWTAWSNWKVAYGCWLTQMDRLTVPAPHVWAWGGGVSLAQLELARRAGCNVAMMSANETRLKQIERAGITPVDRREFPDLRWDEERYGEDAAYRARYRASEKAFLEVVARETDGEGVSIFIDNIGLPVYRATLRALARQGVVTTAGWKHGMHLKTARAMECIDRHIHVNTHALRLQECVEVVQYQDKTGWLPEPDDTVFAWEDVPRLADCYAREQLESYFPVFEINKL